MPNARPLHALPLLAALVILPACRSHPQPKPTTRLAATAPTTSPSTRPATRPALLDIRRGIGSFPLATTRPIDSTASLADALRAGYLARLTPADPVGFLTVTGSLPSLDVLRADVSDAAVRRDYRPTAFGKETTTERSLTVRRLEYLARGLSYNGSSVRVSLTAAAAHLDLVRDSKGSRGLAIAGARRGRFEFHAATRDLNRIVTFAGDGSRLTVLRTSFSFASDGPHSLSLDLEVRARWILLPMTFTLHGRLATSPRGGGDVTFSDLAATGYDPGGLLAAAFLNPELHKMDGHTQPIVSFADPDTRVTDVRFLTTDGLTLTVDFGK